MFPTAPLSDLGPTLALLSSPRPLPDLSGPHTHAPRSAQPHHHSWWPVLPRVIAGVTPPHISNPTARRSLSGIPRWILQGNRSLRTRRSLRCLLVRGAVFKRWTAACAAQRPTSSQERATSRLGEAQSDFADQSAVPASQISSPRVCLPTVGRPFARSLSLPHALGPVVELR